jgi:hypothetical protein
MSFDSGSRLTHDMAGERSIQHAGLIAEDNTVQYSTRIQALCRHDDHKELCVIATGRKSAPSPGRRMRKQEPGADQIILEGVGRSPCKIKTSVESLFSNIALRLLNPLIITKKYRTI